MLDHVGLQAKDVEASLDFYLRTFAAIGMREAIRFPHGDSIVVGLSGPDGVPSFWLGPPTGNETRELHIAFRAPDRAAVDAVHEAAVAAGVEGFLAGERAAAGLSGEPFDLVMSGMSPAAPAAATDLVGPLAEAGATWWAECVWDDLERAEPMVRRVDRGPPPLA